MVKLGKLDAKAVEKNQSHARVCHFVTNGLNGTNGQIVVKPANRLMVKMVSEFDHVGATV